LPKLRNLQSASASLYQAYAEFGFEFGEVLAEHRFCDTERRPCGGKATVLYNLCEIVQVI
jgi:hypothetical protein